MRTINLRPWREERNVFLQKRFYTQLAVTALLAASIVGASYYYLSVMLNRQHLHAARLSLVALAVSYYMGFAMLRFVLRFLLVTIQPYAASLA